MLTYKTSHIDIDENDSEVVIDLWNEITIKVEPRNRSAVVSKGRGAFGPPCITGTVREDDGERVFCESPDWFVIGDPD